MTEASLQNSLQSAAKGGTQKVPQREVYEYLAAHPGQPIDCNVVATHFNVIGYAKDKIAKDMSSIYLAHRGEFERDALVQPYRYTYKGNGVVARPWSAQRENIETFLAKRAMKHLKANHNQYFSPKELSAAMGADEKKIAGALGTAFRGKAGKSNGLLRIANGISFKYAINRKSARKEEEDAPVNITLNTPTTSVASLSSLIAEVITLDATTRAVALKVGRMMAALSLAVRDDFVAWCESLEGGK